MSKGLGGGAEHDVDLVEVLEDLGQTTDGAGEAVDPLDQQEVETAERASASARWSWGRSRLLPHILTEKRAGPPPQLILATDVSPGVQ